MSTTSERPLPDRTGTPVPENHRPEDQRPEDQRPEDQRPEGQAPEGQRPGPPLEVVLPPLGAVGLIRWAWRQLTSMRTALLLLLLLAVAAVPGSVLPQRRIDPSRVGQYLADHPGYGGLLDRLGFFDVYSSIWFSAIYLLLFVSLVGCVLPRSRVHLKALRAAPPRTPRRLDRLPGHTTVVVDQAPAEALDAAVRALRRAHYRVARHDDLSVSAERGYLAETGNLAFHLALLGLLVAVAAGSLLGYSGQVLVVEGASFSNALPYYDSFTAGPSVDRGSLRPFGLTLDRLRVRFDEKATGSQFGAPREFDADLTVRDAPGAAPRQVTIHPNEPLDSGGVRVFIVGNGYAPVLTVRDGKGQVAFSGPVPFLPAGGNYKSLGVVKVPYAAPQQLAFQGFFLPTYAIDPVAGPVSLFPDALLPRLALTAFVAPPGDRDALSAGGVYSLPVDRLQQLKGTDGAPLRLLVEPGATTKLPGGAGSITFEGLRRYAALDVRYDPSKLWVLGFALVALAGVTTSLFMKRRRVWVRAAPEGGEGGGGRTVVEAAALARGDDPRLADDVRSLLAAAGMAPPAGRGAENEE